MTRTPLSMSKGQRSRSRASWGHIAFAFDIYICPRISSVAVFFLFFFLFNYLHIYLANKYEYIIAASRTACFNVE